jgi:hypothetical protein
MASVRFVRVVNVARSEITRSAGEGVQRIAALFIVEKSSPTPLRGASIFKHIDNIVKNANVDEGYSKSCELTFIISG